MKKNVMVDTQLKKLSTWHGLVIVMMVRTLHIKAILTEV